jgi:hypothetical protein
MWLRKTHIHFELVKDCKLLVWLIHSTSDPLYAQICRLPLYKISILFSGQIPTTASSTPYKSVRVIQFFVLVVTLCQSMFDIVFVVKTVQHRRPPEII